MSSSFLAAAATLASDAAAETRVAAALRKLVDEGECRGTRLRHLPAPAAKRCAEHRDLDLNGNMLEALPAELFAPPSRRELRTLSACRNRLRHVDPSLSALRCKKLHLQCNALSAVPALPAGLQHLDLSSNLLAGHVEVGEPSSPQPELRVLRLGRNAIASLGLGLPALASLDVGRNALVELPAPLPPSLQKLSAPRNRLESVVASPASLLRATRRRARPRRAATRWRARHRRVVTMRSSPPSSSMRCRAPSAASACYAGCWRREGCSS